MKSRLILLFLVVSAFFLRIYGINWDQDQHLHPDERFLTMVLADTKLPSSIAQYFNTATSPLNPYNYPQYQFFVYGTFPLFLTKIISSIFHQDTYYSGIFWGRGLSAFFDTFNVVLLFLISQRLFAKKSKFIFLPSLLYTFCILPIQLSHFFAVDTFLNTFILACFTALTYGSFPLAGLFFGLALSCKVTAIYFTPIILIFIFYQKKDFTYALPHFK